VGRKVLFGYICWVASMGARMLCFDCYFSDAGCCVAMYGLCGQANYILSSLLSIPIYSYSLLLRSSIR
jgi:hypothetical protein